MHFFIRSTNQMHQPKRTSKQLKMDAIVQMGSGTRCPVQRKHTMSHACHSPLSIRCTIDKQLALNQKDISTKPVMIIQQVLYVQPTLRQLFAWNLTKVKSTNSTKI